MGNYAKHITTKSTPQNQPILGMTNQVKNNAGGYVFEVSDQALLERFLVLGSEGGTYYAGEKKLTLETATSIIEMIRRDGKAVVHTVVTFTRAKRAPKEDPAIFVLALCTTFGDEATKAAAYKAIEKICYTATQLFMFCENIKALRGWSRGLRSGVSLWYQKRDTESLIYQLLKYRQRNGWTHRDVLRLAHTKPMNGVMSSLFSYATKGELTETETKAFPLLAAFEEAQTASTKRLVDIINKHPLMTWEMVPTDKLKEKSVLEALLQKMPMTATIRQLNRFTAAGLFTSRTDENTQLVVKRLTDVEQLRKGRVHPITLLNAMRMYAQGRGDKGSLVWSPNQAIVDAMSEGFELSFTTLEPTNKRILVGVDISGSMHAKTTGLSISCHEAAAAIALAILKTEPNAELMYFSDRVHQVKVGKRSSYEEVLRSVSGGGGTDCSLPYKYAKDKKLNCDAIITLTDNETWSGHNHPIQAFDSYKASVRPDCKGVVLGMAVNKFNLFPKDYLNGLNIAGLDSSVPNLINLYLKD